MDGVTPTHGLQPYVGVEDVLQTGHQHDAHHHQLALRHVHVAKL